MLMTEALIEGKEYWKWNSYVESSSSQDAYAGYVTLGNTKKG